eukprot:3921151-Rhodomonas_salina.1
MCSAGQYQCAPHLSINAPSISVPLYAGYRCTPHLSSNERVGSSGVHHPLPLVLVPPGRSVSAASAVPGAPVSTTRAVPAASVSTIVPRPGASVSTASAVPGASVSTTQ